MTIPLAHLGHYLWIFYVLPVVIVVVGILRTTILQRRREPGSLSEVSGPGEPAPTEDPPRDPSTEPNPPGG
jgi:cytochrome c-type biogenesis protein CcmH/NrfF